MPGVFQLSVDQLPAEIDELRELGIPAVILFGLPERKDAVGSEAYDPQTASCSRRSAPSRRTTRSST